MLQFAIGLLRLTVLECPVPGKIKINYQLHFFLASITNTHGQKNKVPSVVSKKIQSRDHGTRVWCPKYRVAYPLVPCKLKEILITHLKHLRICEWVASFSILVIIQLYQLSVSMFGDMLCTCNITFKTNKIIFNKQEHHNLRVISLNQHLKSYRLDTSMSPWNLECHII